ncbi:MAG: hypothetical protein IJ752_00050 [Alphaproteobacteria bacterium]|nr:hypothetical protein [Alphaproteobacteria bacterium]
MMIREKAKRLFRRIKRNWRPALLLWLPAGIVVLFLGIVFFSVAFSEDASFHACTRQLPVCVGENPKFSRILSCSYQTAWCDVKIIWDKANGRNIPLDLPGLPPIDEKADQELFEKLTSDEFLEKRFEEFQREEKDAEALSSKEYPQRENLKEYMEELRAKRISFEKEMAEKRARVLQEETAEIPKDDNLSGQMEK